MGVLKTKIKNDLWRWNYILPFVKKHQFDEKGKLDVIRNVLRTYRNIHPVKGDGKRSVGNDTKALLASVEIWVDQSSRFVYFLDTSKTLAVPGNILSNFTLDYDKIIHGTFESLAKSAVGLDNYGREAQAVAEGVHILVQRILEALRKIDSHEKTLNRRIWEFERMLTDPAEHFEEGLQRILFFNQIMWQTRHRLNGLGRLDKMLNDLYQKDIKSGVLSKEEAAEAVKDFLAQLSRYADYKSDALEGDIGQIIILGGSDSDGRYFSCELTEIFLREQAKLRKPDPKTLLRVSKNMPDDLLRLAVECLSSKTGSPLFSNDDRVIPTLMTFGIPTEDAYNYCTSACWEPYIVGKSLDQNNVAVFDFFAALEEIMNMEQPVNFESFVDHYITVNREKFRKFLGILDKIKWAKDPFVSLFMDGCTEKRRDITEGATLYNNYGVTTVALSNVVDSLRNIKKLVYDTHMQTLQSLKEACDKDFQGYDALYNIINAEGHYYGHDEDATIALTERITASVADVAFGYRNALGGTVKFGLSSPGYNILSKKTGADLSGRRRKMAYNTHISCVDASYTEVACFASKLSYDRQRFNGNVVDFFVAPSFLQENSSKFVLFMKGAICQGFFQMQMNVLDSRTLLEAKTHPERYAGLVVRVWGFSAYFNDLPESYKDLLIERAVAAEKAA